MKPILKMLFLLSLLFGCGNDEDIRSNIDEIFSEFSVPNSPGVSILVRKNNEIIYQKGIGFADIENNIPISANTNFRLASITKQFTSYSILILENEGRLSLTDNLKKFFPELPDYAENITIENVLQHTAGLLAYEDYLDETDTTQLKDLDVLKILADHDSTYFTPGSEHRYSNSGYAILALLVERVSGKSFANFLDENIFTPLQMNNTVAYEKGISVVNNRAYGYANTDSGFVFSDQSLTSAVLGDGGIYSSTVDLLKWDDEINNPKLLPQDKFKRIFEKGITIDGQKFEYGYGWRLDPYENYSRPYHTGSTCGFSNMYMKIPEENLTIIVLMNVRDYDAKGYAEKIADLFIK